VKPFGKLISLDDALSIIGDAVKPVAEAETVNLDKCPGRVLAVDIIARLNTPPFTRAAMDGYAVIACDTFGSSRRQPMILEVAGVSYAGTPSGEEIKSGQCIRIATGARMPEGADAVVMVEDTEAQNGDVKIFKAAYPKANTASEGEDITKGELVLKKNSLLKPAGIGVLASQGMVSTEVYRKPTVSIMPTGHEVGAVGEKLGSEQVYDINSHTVSAIVGSSGCMPHKLPITGDDPQELNNSLTRALESDAVVISGGSSVGERDLLYSILKERGKVLFHGIQVKPGKPTLFGVVEGKPVFGMPGYPTSCLINAYILLKPALLKLANLPPEQKLTAEAELSDNVSGSIGRRQFLPVKLEGNIATPTFKESGAITTTAQADGYIIVMENIDILEKGGKVTVTLF